jgi:CubicO group peptidase (beta-lactamase class C family)
MTTNLDTSQIADPDFRQLCDYVVERMAEYSVPGVAVGVLRGGQEFTAGFGITNVEAPVPVDANTLFQIGSTSKTFTGTVVMRLVEEGKLDLDAPIRTYLPNLTLKDEEACATSSITPAAGSATTSTTPAPATTRWRRSSPTWPS